MNTHQLFGAINQVISKLPGATPCPGSDDHAASTPTLAHLEQPTVTPYDYLSNAVIDPDTDLVIIQSTALPDPHRALQLTLRPIPGTMSRAAQLVTYEGEDGFDNHPTPYEPGYEPSNPKNPWAELTQREAHPMMYFTDETVLWSHIVPISDQGLDMLVRFTEEALDTLFSAPTR